MDEKKANGLANTIGKFLVDILDTFKKIFSFLGSIKDMFGTEE